DCRPCRRGHGIPEEGRPRPSRANPAARENKSYRHGLRGRKRCPEPGPGTAFTNDRIGGRSAVTRRASACSKKRLGHPFKQGEKSQLARQECWKRQATP